MHLHQPSTISPTTAFIPEIKEVACVVARIIPAYFFFFSDCRISVSFFFIASDLNFLNVADHWFHNELRSSELVGFHLYTDSTEYLQEANKQRN